MASPRSTYYDGSGRPVPLGVKLGEGGEGSVFTRADSQAQAVKVYHYPPPPIKSSKIAAMTRMANERLTALAAWPLDTIHATPGGALIGFTMPNVTGHKPVFELYSPKCRLQQFPTAGWPFLIHCAGNTARAFRVTHATNTVIGDVNHGNLLIARDATVKLIDCDSFQVRVGSHEWLCEVGVPEFQPELQGVNFTHVVRHANHDNFGLAVLVFRLLFMGRHPFIGQYLGNGDMPVERAIKEYRFAYGRNAAASQMRPPPGSLRMDDVTPTLGNLFERAFSREGAQYNGRPSPDEWVSALEELAKNLKTCSANHGHQFYSSLPKCPWCDIETYSGFTLFPVVFIGGAGAATFNIASLWQRVISIPDPGTAASLPNLHAAKANRSPGANQMRSLRWKRFLLSAAMPIPCLGIASVLSWSGGVAILAAEVLATLALAYGGQRGETRALRSRIDSARVRWTQIESQWGLEASANPFAMDLAKLQLAKSKYEGLEQERTRRLHALELNRQTAQKEAFLNRCYIATAHIKGIGDGRKAILLAHNIETAADVEEHRIRGISGFGDALAGNLLEWRRAQESRFRFDPTKGVDQAEKARVEQSIRLERARLERLLSQGVDQLAAVSQRIINRRQAMSAEADHVSKTFAQASVDLTCVMAPWRAHIALVVITVIAFALFLSRPSIEHGLPVGHEAVTRSAPPPPAAASGPNLSARHPPDQIGSKRPPNTPPALPSQAPLETPAPAPANSGGQSSVPSQAADGPPQSPLKGRVDGAPNSPARRPSLPYPRQMTDFLDPTDWPFVLSALTTAENIETVAIVSWSNPSDSHDGFVRREDFSAPSNGCVRYRIERTIENKTRSGDIEVCDGQVVR